MCTVYGRFAAASYLYVYAPCMYMLTNWLLTRNSSKTSASPSPQRRLLRGHALSDNAGCGIVADRLIDAGMPRIKARKIVQTLVFGGPFTAMLIMLVLKLKTPALVTGIFRRGWRLRQSCPRPTTGTGQTSSFGPVHAGLLCGISNKFGTIPGICAFSGRHTLAI